MSIAEVIGERLAPYTIRGDELVPEYCPFCRGGEHRDRRTFALNMADGVYVCKRGSCGAKGRVETLARRLGEGIVMNREMTGQTARKYTSPDTRHTELTPAILSYFESRKIGRETLEAFRIASDENGNIVFPFYRDGVNVYEKFRKPRKPAERERKEWQFPGAQPILFGMDMCTRAQPLIITEGQLDCMSLYEAGARNVVSVPCGCDNLDWIEHCWDWLEQFETVVLFGDNDEPGRKMARNVARRLDEARCMIVEEYPLRPDSDRPTKDANEILYFHGADALMET